MEPSSGEKPQIVQNNNLKNRLLIHLNVMNVKWVHLQRTFLSMILIMDQEKKLKHP